MNKQLVLAVISGCVFTVAVVLAQKESAAQLLKYVDAAATELKPEQQRVLQKLKSEDTAVDVQLVRFDASALDGPNLEIGLPDGAKCSVANGRKSLGQNDTINYSGSLVMPNEDSPRRPVTFTYRGGNGMGSFSVNKFSYNIRPIGDGLHVIIKRDPAKLKTEEPPEAIQRLQKESEAKQKPAASNRGDAPSQHVVTVMVLYTPAVKANHGESALPVFIDHVISVSNKTYLDSSIPVKLDLVHSEEVDYTESGSVETDVGRLANTSDQIMDNIHGVRNQKKADVVVLLIDHADAYGMAAAILAEATTAFAAVDDEVADWYFTFAHEVGHLFGCRHNVGADGSTTPFAYGHCLCKADKQWRTIMSYDCTGSSTRIGIWSSPNLKYPPMTGDPAGSAEKEDNARVIRETAATIAAFR